MAKSKRQKDLAEAQRAKDKTDHWLIIYNPWCRNHRKSPTLSDRACQDIAWWLQAVFQIGIDRVTGIQHKNNHPFVIAKVDLDVQIEPRLGRHDWVHFLQAATDYERRENSRIFEYNFIRLGHPSDKQWEEYYPLSRPPPHDFPVVHNYPAPVWCERRNLGAAIDWCLPITRPPTSSANAQDGPSDHVDLDALTPHLPRGRSPPSPMPPPTMRSRPPLPLHGQAIPVPAPPLTIFRPYETPAHHPLHRLTLADNNTAPIHVRDRDFQVVECASSTVAAEEKPEVKVKREPSPIRVPYDEDTKLKREPSPIRVLWEDIGKLPDLQSGGGIEPDSDDASTLQLTYPDSDTEPEPRAALKIEPGTAKLELSSKTSGSLGLPSHESRLTQLVLIRNPFGVRWPTDDSLPDVSGIWDWLQLFADGAEAVYPSRLRAPAPNEEYLIVRLRGDLDLQGVLGRHEWRKMLKKCPPDMVREVSTVIPCSLDPETQVLDRIDAPEPTENYELFSFPYPAPLPLLKEEDTKAVKVKIEGVKKRELEDHEDVTRKRAKREVAE